MTKIKVLKRARKTNIPRWKIRKTVKEVYLKHLKKQNDDYNKYSQGSYYIGKKK